MKTRTILAGSLCLALLATAGARAQGTYESAPTPQAVVPVAGTAAPAGPSSWITYCQPECCGPIGGNGLIDTELFLRVGSSTPVHGQEMANRIETGVAVAGGGRSLFFTPTSDAACLVEFSLSHVYNNGNRPNLPLILHAEEDQPVTIRDLQRTFFNLSLGGVFYLHGTAHCHEPTWRVGCDGGGRLGVARVDLNNPETFSGFQRIDETIGGFFFALHSDVEVPCGFCTYLYGVRAEWERVYMDIERLEGKDDIQSVNVLFTAGVRF